MPRPIAVWAEARMRGTPTPPSGEKDAMAKTMKFLKQVRKRVRAAEKRGRRWRPRGSDLRVFTAVT